MKFSTRTGFNIALSRLQYAILAKIPYITIGMLSHIGEFSPQQRAKLKFLRVTKFGKTLGWDMR